MSINKGTKIAYIINMTFKKDFGKKVKEIREARGLTQDQLAELIDYETQSLSLVENGHRGVSFATLEKLVKVLNTEPADLFTFEETQNPPALIKTIIKSLTALDAESLRYIINVIKEFVKYKTKTK